MAELVITAKNVVFNMAAGGRHILNLVPVSIFIIWSSLDSAWGCSCKIS